MYYSLRNSLCFYSIVLSIGIALELAFQYLPFLIKVRNFIEDILSVAKTDKFYYHKSQGPLVASKINTNIHKFS